MGVGLCFCFCGGLYPTLFAAVEALRLTGWAATKQAVMRLMQQAKTVLEANKKDNLVDDDNDGIADVKQIDSKTLLLRKTNLVVTTCDPAQVDAALTGLYTSWLAVAAVLKVRFARTISLAMSIASTIRAPTNQYILPALKLAVPPAYHAWLPVLIGWACKSFAISIAWFIQRILSAAASSVRGGTLAIRALTNLAYNKGLAAKLGGALPANVEDTQQLQRILGWALAALGFYVQYKFGFQVPFPLNILTWPLQVGESALQWAVTTDLGAAAVPQ